MFNVGDWVVKNIKTRNYKTKEIEYIWSYPAQITRVDDAFVWAETIGSNLVDELAANEIFGSRYSFRPAVKSDFDRKILDVTEYIQSLESLITCAQSLIKKIENEQQAVVEGKIENV